MNAPRPTPTLTLEQEIDRLRTVRQEFLRQADAVGQMIERVEALRNRQIEGQAADD